MGGTAHSAPAPQPQGAGARLRGLASAGLAALWLVQMVYLVTRWPPLAGLSVALLGMFLVLALVQASRHMRLMFALVWAVACALALGTGRPGLLWNGLEQAMIFGAFLPSLLMLRATAQSSALATRFRERCAGLDGHQAVQSALLGAHGLGSVLSVGVMGVLTIGVAREATESQRIECAGAAVRGMSTAVMWSPFFVAMGFSSQLVPAAPLSQVMLTGLGLALLGLALSMRLFTPDIGWRATWQAAQPLSLLVAPMALAFGAVLALNAWGYSGLQAVALALPVLCVAYLARRDRATATAVARTTLAHFGRLSDEMLVVVGASVLGVCIAALPAVQAAAQGMDATAVHGAWLLVVLVAGLYTLGQVGVHPMIGAGLVLPVLGTGAFGIHPVALVSATVFAWGLSASSSIWTLPFATAAATFEVPVTKLWHAKALRYTLLLGAAGMAYLLALNAWLLEAG
ncbi:MAG: hypothetical protein RI988_2276 [Pseudomonadota bacterium]|jgi:hypothetical protein